MNGDIQESRKRVFAILDAQRPRIEECYAQTLVKMERERPGSLKETLGRIRRRNGDAFADRLRARCADIWREQVRQQTR